jgi:hypothetical protein
MGPLRKDSIYDIIWCIPDQIHFMIARPDFSSIEEEKQYFERLWHASIGTASFLVGSNAHGIEIEDIIKEEVDNHNQGYQNFIDKLNGTNSTT